MPMIAVHGRRGYKQGCRCEKCKSSERAYQQDLRQRKQFGDLTAVADFSNSAPVSADDSVESGVRAEIADLNAPRPGLVATAIALAKVMDDPRATSSKPAAAAKLADMLETLRKAGDTKKSKLASVRSMTSVNTKTG
jgi:hypothetical protein